MEANYEQRGFASNGKLVMSLYQASNPSSSTVHDVRLVIPNQSSSVASVSRYSDAQSIDAKAASYISTVRQRFTLEWSEQTTSLSCRDGVASDYTSVLIYSIMYAVLFFNFFFFLLSLNKREAQLNMSLCIGNIEDVSILIKISWLDCDPMLPL